MRLVLSAVLALLLASLSPNAAAKFMQVDAGNDHTCAVTSGGGVMCWGHNSYGQLGFDSDGVDQPTAHLVPDLTGVIAVSAGGYHTCAVKADGGAVCWGYNNSGQLGTGDTIDHPMPQQVQDLGSGVVAISAGVFHTCALKEGGGVVCWGENFSGQLGSGSNDFMDYHAPHAIAGLDGGVLAISAGGEHTCALKSGGSIVCWGKNTWGQLGSSADDFSNQPTPTPVLGLPEAATAISAGDEHSCARLTGGGMACWGVNGDGQLGPTPSNPQPLPQAVAGLSGVEVISPGGDHTCVLLTGGTVACMGYNVHGELGTGMPGYSDSTPQAVVGLAGVTALSAGFFHTCALTTAGTVACWGENVHGQLGNGSHVNEANPQPVGAGLSGVIDLTAGATHSCALTAAGTVACWGENGYGQVDPEFPGLDHPLPQWLALTNVDAISAGYYHTCSLSDGEVSCWGLNSDGELGTGDFASYSSPQPVTGLAGVYVVAISAGRFHTCALTSNHTVVCWGANSEGQLTGIAGEKQSLPQNLPLAGIVQITAGGHHTCARHGNGTAYCWGWNDQGQLGRGTFGDSPDIKIVAELTDIASIQAGWQHTCATRSPGFLTAPLYCWGSDVAGQLGNGDPLQNASTPQFVGQLSTLLDTGMLATCADASLADDVVKCWGGNGYGQLGTGSFGSYSSPTPTPGFAGVSAMAIGEKHACGLQPDGTVICSGWGYYGQRGDGVLGYAASPQWVVDPLQMFADGFEQ